jgi:hypothetical protein
MQPHIFYLLVELVVPLGGLGSITVRLTSPAALAPAPAAEEPDSSMQTLRDAYYFLQEHGYINFGVVKGA